MIFNGLLFVVPVLMLLFALGEQFGWWDKLTGRAAAKTGLERFRSAEGYPKTWIYKDRMEDRKIFEALEKRINQKTSSETVKNVIREGYRPSIISVGGPTDKVMGLAPGIPYSRYSEIHPVMYLYMDDDGSGGGQGKTGQVATLGELSQWLEDEKKNRNFWVASIFVGGILSIVILLIRLWDLDIPPGLPPSDEPAPPRTVP